MKRIEVRGHFACTPAAAFHALSDHESLGGLPTLRSVLVEEGSPDRNGVGAVRSIGGSGVTMLEKVTAFEPGHYYEYQIIGGTLPLDHNGGRVEVAEADGGTDVVWTTEFGVRIPWIGVPLNVCAAAVIRFSLERIMASAKRQAESA
jgi:hypothetical protein